MKQQIKKHGKKILIAILLAAAAVGYGRERAGKTEEIVWETAAENPSGEESESALEQIKEPEKQERKEYPEEQETRVVSGEKIFVHVCGAVHNPGVYALDKDSRIVDAVDAAGGFLADAAEDYVNLARPAQDGQQIYVPDKEEAKQQKEAGAGSLLSGDPLGSGQETALAGSGGLVNINTADKEQLMTLPGIGEAKAEAIIACRREAGPFLSIEEIMNVPGIKEAAFHQIKDKITV